MHDRNDASFVEAEFIQADIRKRISFCRGRVRFLPKLFYKRMKKKIVRQL
ncbi:AAEL017388-PA [Aedes aegypti]|uniref:AAEL017388-PA n=1 Tax=Aedes aegypti TaxID=7159 RepID=J9HF87_AEDAE|nr:AAEL017388-PA [Aedes aegypti]